MRTLHSPLSGLGGFVLLCCVSSIPAASQDVGEVLSHAKLSDTSGGFSLLSFQGRFGQAVAHLGDLDGDGTDDMAVGASRDDEGAVWILFLRPDGTVKREQKIAEGQGGFGGTLRSSAEFGAALESLGDLDGDGVVDLAVGASHERVIDYGQIWILFLDTDGTVKAEQEISDGVGGMGSVLNGGLFGCALGCPGDLDGDGVSDLIVGNKWDNAGVNFEVQGGIWVLFLNPDGTVKSYRNHSATAGDLVGVLGTWDRFGSGIAPLGDFDGDGVPDIAVGAEGDGAVIPFEPGFGAVWIVCLRADGTLKSLSRIANGVGGFPSYLDMADQLGCAVACPGDLDGDGVVDLAVGALGDDDGQEGAGAVWLLYLNAGGTVKSVGKISLLYGGFASTLDRQGQFGCAVDSMGDFDGDGVVDLATAAPIANAGGLQRGEAWLLFLEGIGDVRDEQEISDVEGSFGGGLADGDEFGAAATSLGDLDGDGMGDALVGAPGDGVDGPERGAAWVFFSKADGSAESFRKIAGGRGAFGAGLDDGDRFGSAAALLGDLSGLGRHEVILGAPGDDDGALGAGAVWVLSLDDEGAVVAEQKISATVGGFSGGLVAGDAFGSAAANLGDLDGDGSADVAVGAPGCDDGGGGCGAVWVLFLNPDGTVRAEQKISATAGGFGGVLGADDGFGASLAGLGDLDGDGFEDLVVGAPGDDDGAAEAGAFWVLFLHANGTVKAQQEISALAGGFTGALAAGDAFGSSLASLGDISGDGVPELLAGAPADDDGGVGRGAAWVVFLDTDGTVSLQRKISATVGGFVGTLADADGFGAAVASLGDLDGDGFVDAMVGTPGDDSGGTAPDAERGAVWNLFLAGCPTASAVFRTDSNGRNATDYVASPPVLGATWQASVDNGPHGNAVAWVVGYAAPDQHYIWSWGLYILVDVTHPAGELCGFSPQFGTGVVTFSATVPTDPVLSGFPLSTQGVGAGGGGGIQLHNAYDLVVGL